MQLTDILSLDRTVNNIDASSKKRALELSSELAASALEDIDAHQVFECLLARERLGSTGIGHGVALPHCRLKGLDKAVGTLIHLKAPINFEALDKEPVDLLFILLVPEESTEEHLKLLAELAELFANDKLRQQLRITKNDQTLYQTATHYDG